MSGTGSFFPSQAAKKIVQQTAGLFFQDAPPPEGAIRSAKSGLLLPREGILVKIVENLGRNLILIDFGKGMTEYLFEHEIKVSTGAEATF